MRSTLLSSANVLLGASTKKSIKPPLWCEEHLDAIEVSLTKKSWIDSIGNDPQRQLGHHNSSIVNDNNNTDSYSTFQP